MHAVETFEVILILLALVFALHWVALKLKWPPATVLLVGGGAIAFVPGLPEVVLDPSLALALFLPPLLVDGAFHTALGRFRRHLAGILSLAVGAVIFTTLAVGVVTHWLVPSLPWGACFALGAVVSPPDAVSARAVLKGVSIPRRLTTLLEGESLLNDATGLIVFRFAVAAALTGAFSLGQAAWSFSILAVGGVIVGLAIGYAWYFIVQRLHDRMLIIGATLLLSWVAYLAGEALHVSGVIAVVVAGLVQGWHQHTVIPAGVRLQGRAVAELTSFVLEALVFILIGFSLRGVIERMGEAGGLETTTVLAVLGVVVTVAVARFVWIFAADGFLTLAHRLGRKRTPLGWRQATVLSWAGMRGVVTLAIALTTPIDMPGRDLILISAFAVIFVTIILQGSSLGWLIRLVRPVDLEPQAETSMAQAELIIARAKHSVIHAFAHAPDGTVRHPQMLELHTRRVTFMERYAQNAQTELEDMQPQFDAVLDCIAAGRAALIDLHRKGLIEDEVLHSLERDLDVEELGVMFQRSE
ncbi:Na+/H+ antiporter [Brevundimonas sp.]|uniref:Na+/H+ antiporter n=1 Tax=Brevundimonas sp. TaxID=1871086 RepID=UPI002FDB4617